MFMEYGDHSMRRWIGTLVLMSGCMLLLPERATAWGQEGHQIVAGLAETYLQAHSPQALAKAKSLLGGKSLVDVATFADDVRAQRPYTKNWHFVDIPLEEASYNAARDCKATANGDCAVQALDRFRSVLADKSEDPCIRAEALKFIVHLVGDIHQPLHNVDDHDAGGNGKTVVFFDLEGFHGGPPNLHEVWDSGILEHSGQSIPELVASLGSAEDASPDPGDATLWVQDSHKLAIEAYQRLPKIDDEDVYVLDEDSSYFDAGLVVVKDQLRKAGLRLGKILEKALG